MMEEDPSYATYGEAYEVHCARTGREADLPLTHFKRRCSAPNGQLHPDLELRFQVCPDLLSQHITDTQSFSHQF